MLIAKVFTQLLDYCRAGITLHSLLLLKPPGSERAVQEAAEAVMAHSAALMETIPTGGAKNPDFTGIVPFFQSPVLQEREEEEDEEDEDEDDYDEEEEDEDEEDDEDEDEEDDEDDEEEDDEYGEEKDLVSSFNPKQSQKQIYAALREEKYLLALQLLKAAPEWPPLLIPVLIRHNLFGVFKLLSVDLRAKLQEHLEDDRTADECQVTEAFRQLVEESGVLDARFIDLLRLLGWTPSPTSAYVLFHLAFKYNWKALLEQLVITKWVEWNNRLPGHFGTPLLYAVMSGRTELMEFMQSMRYGRCQGTDNIDMIEYDGPWEDDADSWLPDTVVIEGNFPSAPIEFVYEANDFLPADPPVPVFKRKLRSVKDQKATLIEPGWSALKIAFANARFNEKRRVWDSIPTVVAEFGAFRLFEEEMKDMVDEKLFKYAKNFMC